VPEQTTTQHPAAGTDEQDQVLTARLRQLQAAVEAGER
jgi:hypothetical protein